MVYEIVSPILSTCGLVLDIIGIWILARYSGVFSKFILKNMNRYDMPAEDEEKRMYEKERRTTKQGLALITIGFSLQAIGIWFNFANLSI